MSFPRLLHWIGLAACIMLVVSCFLPWTYYPNDPFMKEEAQRTFTGFYTFGNYYGKPGKFLTLIAGISLLLKILPRVWAKRTDLFVTAVGIAYSARIYVEYTGSYTGITPQVKYGLVIMLVSIFTVFIASLFPDMKLFDKKS